MFNVYDDHKAHVIHTPVTTVEEGRELARSYAAVGINALFRLFRQTGFYPNGYPSEQFEVAFSVLGGKVVERHDPTIPLAHWGG